MHVTLEDDVSTAAAHLTFIKCSYWLPSYHNHYVTADFVQVLCDLIGLDRLDEPAHHALSALLSLLSAPIQIIYPNNAVEPPILNSDSKSPQPTFNSQLISQKLWSRFQELEDSYFHSESSRVFRTWFLWVCHAKANNLEYDALYEPLYWVQLRTGLLAGFAEQRKYCLGILRQSISLAQQDITTPYMTVQIDRLPAYQQQYDKYNSLFETIVLDRYPNQVQACLPELTKLFGDDSLISPCWITALLSAALNPKVQDGVRKLIGCWYMNFVIYRGDLAIDDQTEFLIGGFFPWATQGSLFTSTLQSTRDSTICNHGNALSDLIARFIVVAPLQGRRELLVRIIRFILDKGGKIFQYSIIYLLHGILQGFRGQQDDFVNLGVEDLALLIQVSRLPGLPEIATDLSITYCAIFCRTFLPTDRSLEDIPGYVDLNAKFEGLRTHTPTAPDASTEENIESMYTFVGSSPMESFHNQLLDSRYKWIQGDAFVPACDEIIKILDILDKNVKLDLSLYEILDALWEEAERQEFRRPVAVKIPPLFLHPKCIQFCLQNCSNRQCASASESLTRLLVRVTEQLGRLVEGRTYLLSVFVSSLRTACFTYPEILSVLPFEDFLVRFISHPPLPKKDFLFEVAVAERLQDYFPNRTYASYYGKREWHAYAAAIDLLNRVSDSQLGVAKRLLNNLLEPWRTQKKPIPIISKWKETFQLQAMLLLVESCISDSDADWYLNSFMSALVVEQWPRYRYLLEWIISRIYYRFPKLAERILPDLTKLDDAVPVQIASLMRLAVLAAKFLDSEAFGLQLITQLVPFSASPKVHIRHEAHWSFPIVFGLAEQRGWKSIIENPAFKALNKHIRSLDKFKVPASTIRTLRLDPVEDYNLVRIFQGDYLTIESPEREFVVHGDFISLWEDDDKNAFDNLHIRIPLGMWKPPAETSTTLALGIDDIEASTQQKPTLTLTAKTFQTKSSLDLSSLLPASGPPSAMQKRPSSVILIATLIDNPTNLGGLSRISESFGLEALYINDLRHLGSKDFQATAVTSNKHLPIHELKLENTPSFLISLRHQGYEVIGIEQTDQSGILGDEGNKKGGIGTLPQKCVLVLGSEKGGVSAEVLATVDRCVEIKTVGVTRSLNVQTAAGIVVYEWWREWSGKA